MTSSIHFACIRSKEAELPTWVKKDQYIDRKTIRKSLGKPENTKNEYEKKRQRILWDIEVALLLLCLSTLNLATAINQKLMSYLSFDNLSAEYLELNVQALSVTEDTPTVSTTSSSNTPTPSSTFRMTGLLMYRALMPLLGSPGTPMFKGLNITEFLE